MNLKFTNHETDTAFNEALNDSQVVKNWLIGKLGSYTSSKEQKNMTLEIAIDPWTKTDKPSYSWGIYYELDNEFHHIINGGLIYRGDNNYSSHT